MTRAQMVEWLKDKEAEIVTQQQIANDVLTQKEIKDLEYIRECMFYLYLSLKRKDYELTISDI